jgi:low temperature requirement protein LtrA
MSEHHGVLRVRVARQHNRVTFVELFFDLVFVFAVTQLSHTLIEHFTLGDALPTLVLLLAVWWVWIYTTWATNWLDPDNYLVRILLFIIMLAGLFMSSSIPKAFGERGLAFAGAYVFMQVVRTAFVMWAFRDQAIRQKNFRRILVWHAIAALMWLAGGVAEGSQRLLLWSIAVALEFLAPIVRFWLPVWGASSTRDWEVEGAHMAERCGLFIILALGESLLITGGIFSDMTWTSVNVTPFVASFAGTLLLWWLYFDRSAEAASQVIAEAEDPGRLARSAYTYSHIFIVAGIILLAVADEFILAHPIGHTEITTTIALLGGTALYLIGNLLFKWTIFGRIRYSHLLGLVALALLVPAANVLEPVYLIIATNLVLLAIALYESYAYRRLPQSQHRPATVHPD